MRTHTHLLIPTQGGNTLTLINTYLVRTSSHNLFSSLQSSPEYLQDLLGGLPLLAEGRVQGLRRQQLLGTGGHLVHLLVQQAVLPAQVPTALGLAGQVLLEGRPMNRQSGVCEVSEPQGEVVLVLFYLSPLSRRVDPLVQSE